MNDLSELWVFMHGFYGARATALGEQPSGAWRVTLADFDADELRTGMSRLRDRHPSWPPTAGEFVELVRGSPSTRAFNARLEQQQPQRAALPAPEALAAQTRVGRQWLAYWWTRGIRPKPRNVTVDMLDEMLGDAPLDAMDRMVAVGVRRIRGEES